MVAAMKNNTSIQTGSGTPELLTDTQAAAFLAVKPRTLRLWRRSRALPHVKISKRVIRYRTEDLRQWLARRRVAIAA